MQSSKALHLLNLQPPPEPPEQFRENVAAGAASGTGCDAETVIQRPSAPQQGGSGWVGVAQPSDSRWVGLAEDPGSPERGGSDTTASDLCLAESLGLLLSEPLPRTSVAAW